MPLLSLALSELASGAVLLRRPISYKLGLSGRICVGLLTKIGFRRNAGPDLGSESVGESRGIVRQTLHLGTWRQNHVIVRLSKARLPVSVLVDKRRLISRQPLCM